MMQAENQALNAPANLFQEKAAPVMNSQGELIEAQPQQQQQEQQAQPQPEEEDFIELCDTPLSQNMDALMPATDDSGLEHKIISCGHVLKSTHDLARWSEKTGARRVNTQESIDSVSDLAINLEPNRTGRTRRTNNNAQQSGDPAGDIRGLFDEGGRRNAGGRRNGNNRNSWQQQQQQSQQTWQPVEGSGAKSEVIHCWPVLKSTHDQAQISEKRGKNAVNQAGTSETLEELASNAGQQQQTQQQGQQWQEQQQSGTGPILHSWPVLKSTHDLAQFSEKRGANAVNQAAGTGALEEVIKDQGSQEQGFQAGGSNLQSGLDTQAGTHVQMDNTQ